MQRILFILFLVWQTLPALAQRFPVDVRIQSIAPYPTKIVGYTDVTTTHSPLRIQLVFNDITANPREVRLAIGIEGNGINTRSTPVVIGATPLILEGGIPINLDNTLLAPYFELQNLQGVSTVQYNAPLPNGSYRICATVFDAFTGNVLSAQECTQVYLITNEPPFLNLPLNQAELTEQNPMNLRFQWTPRHVNVPNVSYEFSLVEIWDRYMDPQALFLASPALYQETTRNTSLIYGPAQPLLLPGKRYAWRVRAFSNENPPAASVFDNQGYSEIFWFDYQGHCEAPMSIKVKDVSMTNATFHWSESLDHLDYTIHYRELGSQKWYTKTTPRNYITIDEFRPDTAYEYKVEGHCNKTSSADTLTKQFRTQSEEIAEYTSCGIPADEVDLSNQELLAELFENDKFTAGDFPVYVKKVSGSSSFTGEGYISTPWLATVRIPVKFENIKINTDMKLVDGFVVTTYDPNWGSIVDTDEIIEEIVGDTGDIDIINVDADIVDVVVNEDNSITITTSDGVEINRPGGEDEVYVDNTGETWSVGEDGTVTQGEQAEGGPVSSGNTAGFGGNNSGVKEITSTDVRVEFSKGNGYYGFDEVHQNAGGNIASKYDKIATNGDEAYYIPYKAISNLEGHTSDVLTATATFNNTDFTKDDIVFKTKEGVKIQANWNGDIATLSLKKSFDFAKQQIIASVKPKKEDEKYTIAGAVNLWHLASQQVADINVSIIPINNVSVSNTIADKINAIYNPAGVNFNISIGNRLTIEQSDWDLNGNGQLDIGDSDLLAHYTDEQRAIKNYFKTNTADYKEETYYIFINELPTTDQSIDGFMPLKRQYGFIFGKENRGRTIAHELAHGIFGLEHPFTEYKTDSGTTNLLMDYGRGTAFTHIEWEKMHAPGIQIYWFQDDEDGELNGKVWFTPDWKPIKINASSTIVYNTTSEDVKGTLPGFKIDNIKYTALFDSGKFLGYFEGGKLTGKKYQISGLNADGLDEVFLFVKGDSNCDKIYKSTYSYAIKNKNSIVYDNNKFIKETNIIKCAECPKGKQFIEDYLSSGNNQLEKDAIESIAGLICAEGEDKIDYDVLVSQINKDNEDHIDNIFWLSDKGMYKRALENYWNKSNQYAFRGYFLGLQKVSNNITAYNKKLGSDTLTKEELYAGLFYLNDDFIKSLELQQKKNLLKLVFDNNVWWISDGTFGESKSSDQSLIKKLINSVSEEDLIGFVKEVGIDSGDRDRLIHMGYELTIKQLALFSVEERLKMLGIILNGLVLDNWSATYSTEDLVLNIIDSVNPNDAEAFLQGLVNEDYRVDTVSGKDLLYKQLVDKLDDSFISDDVNRLAVVTKLAELAFISNGIEFGTRVDITSNSEYQSLLSQAQLKESYYWNVKNERFLWLFNVVKDQSKLEFSFVDDQKKINISQDCLEKSADQAYSQNLDKVCLKWDKEETYAPFELVAIEIINDITFTGGSGACDHNGAIVCGEIALVPAMFIDYLHRKKNNTTIQNGVFNVLTVASIYFSGGTVIGAGGALNSVTFFAYADLFVTAANPYFSDDMFLEDATSAIKTIFNIDEGKAKEIAEMLQTAWTFGTIPFTIDSAASIPNVDKHLDAIAAYRALVKKVGESEALKIISKDPNLGRKFADGLKNASENIEKSSDVSRKLDQKTKSFENKINSKLKVIDNYSESLKVSLLDLLSENSNLKSSLKQLKSSENENLIKKIYDLKPANSGETNLLKSFDNIITEIVDSDELNKLLNAWEIIKKRAPKIAKIPENSKILSKISDRFIYSGKNGFDGLSKLFNEGSDVLSKQKLINGLKEADKLFDNTKLPIKFTAIKAGEVKVINTLDGKVDEIARYVDGILQKKKVIPEDGATLVKKGKTRDDDILQNGKSVGFRKLSNADKNIDDLVSSVEDIHKIALRADLEASKKLLEAIGENPKLIDSWKVLEKASVDQLIRQKPENLEVFKNLIGQYPDIDYSKVNRVLDKQIDPNGFIKNDLGGILKGKDHLRTLVGDFENVPGVSFRSFIDNSLSKTKVNSPIKWNDSNLDLPDWAHETFTTKATPRDLPEGTKIYRVFGVEQNPKGAFWTYDLPTNKAELYGGTAVRPEWNNATSFVEYTVPKGGLKIWEGPAASQRVVEDVDDFMLEGGTVQIYIPENLRANLPDLPINDMIWK